MPAVGAGDSSARAAAPARNARRAQTPAAAPAAGGMRGRASRSQSVAQANRRQYVPLSAAAAPDMTSGLRPAVKPGLMPPIPGTGQYPTVAGGVLDSTLLCSKIWVPAGNRQSWPIRVPGGTLQSRLVASWCHRNTRSSAQAAGRRNAAPSPARPTAVALQVRHDRGSLRGLDPFRQHTTERRWEVYAHILPGRDHVGALCVPAVHGRVDAGTSLPDHAVCHRLGVTALLVSLIGGQALSRPAYRRGQLSKWKRRMRLIGLTL